MMQGNNGGFCRDLEDNPFGEEEREKMVVNSN
jgi:hypothetical protein